MHLPDGKTYEDLVRDFSWQVPEHYNIGVDICDKWADRDPERLALIATRDGGGENRYSFADLKRLSNRLASLLAASGIARGDRVGLLLPQSVETGFAHIAIYKLGAIALPLALLFGAEGLAYRLRDSGASAIITVPEGLEKITPLRPELPDLHTVLCVNATDADADLYRQMDRQPDRFTPVDTLADDPAVMVYTSGTTGPPKGALHAHRVLPGHLPGVAFSHDFFPQEGDLMWTPADWAWAGGLFNILLPAWHFGVPVLAHKFYKFDPQAALALMARYKVRNSFIPPTALKMLRAVPDIGKSWDLKLRSIASGGESLGRETWDWARDELGITINEFYGQTECNLVLSSCAAVGVSRAGAIGRPVPGHEVAVIDEDGKEMPAGELGQIAVKRPDPVMFLEYWNRPEATEKKFIGDWMTTGDQGHVDADGYIHFTGRDDDVITSAGYRIGPGEIEDCLLGHEAVRLAAVIGVPDPVRTQAIKAFIVLKDGYEPSGDLAAELKTHVRERLAAHEYPREVVFAADLPLTTTGKIIRRLLS